MSKEIILTKNQVATVDDEDYEWLSQWKWYAMLNVADGRYRAMRHQRFGPRIENKSKAIMMHRLILGVPDNVEVDHKNLNSLDNQKHNLRQATHSQNNMNRPLRKNNTSGYKGVTLRDSGKWRARIRINKKDISLGHFISAKIAAHAYDVAAKQLFGEFARTNF